MSISRWLRMDLHIHSWISNETKDNDYGGPKYNADKLISKLKQKNINIFSITDHNIINKELYKELVDKKEEFIEQDLNFIIGVELDIKDSKIYGDKVFHALLFFETYDLDKIERIINDLINDKDKEEQPNISKIFETMNDNGERNFILIPHFNNKHKGLKNKDMKKNAIDCLNTMVFDAYEDSNNIKKIQESLNVYSSNGYEDLPMLIFSDCHNIDLYPKYKKESDKEPSFLSILGNIRYPFNSLKLSFQDSNLRIGYEDVEEQTCYRRVSPLINNKYYLDDIEINGEIMKFSEYQNTIIGGFGSGKSFLMKLLLEGKEKLGQTHSKEYGELLSNMESFRLRMSDGSYRESLNEISRECEIILFEQNEGLFYKNIIDEEEKIKLEKKLKIKFPELEALRELDFSELCSAVNRYDEFKSESITDSFNYEALKDRSFYRIMKSKELLDESIDLDIDLSNLKNEKKKQIFKTPIYSKEEQEQIEKTIQLIENKNSIWDQKLKKYDESLLGIDNIIGKFNNKQSEEKVSIASNIKIYESIKNHILESGKILNKMKRKCEIIELNMSEEEYMKHKNKNSIFEYGDYQLITKYKCDKGYKDYKDLILRAEYRNGSLLGGIIETIIDGGKFHRNKEFKNNIEEYYEDIFYDNFSKFNYDIKRNNKSIMERSAGEKANMILELIFNIIEENINNDNKIILLIDQPEDHLDNKNIDSNIVRKIIKLKEKSKLPQFIFVTHNSNVAITADSENIIIAQKHNNKCSYKGSGIEDEEFIEDVCKILEGGPDALKRRGMKFSVSYIKEYLKKETSDEQYN
ncbi:hypothetical protein [Sedimentibacter sp. MB31-C6]|uniref:hypothetical protein n=1 Tax=Sedimentibacter sp. MB31-C6 TaxID=3109366 RepID=UPI002DDCE1D5|nr:hypothetical protein [Sedimentibacter sp. MB36-C1]WSI03175.1 hypothetical protein U8307_08980 [Sedimentibacter sp. MB36-C1]